MLSLNSYISHLLVSLWPWMDRVNFPAWMLYIDQNLASKIHPNQMGPERLDEFRMVIKQTAFLVPNPEFLQILKVLLGSC